MRRSLAAMGAAALVLSACSSDDEPTALEPTATASDGVSDGASDDASDEPEPEATFTPRPAATPRLPDDFEAPSASGDADADADADAGADDAGDDEASATGGSSASGPLGSFATSQATAPTSSPFQALAEPVSRAKNVDPSASCQVLADASETITSCQSGFVSSRGDQPFAVVTAADNATGEVSTRLYADTGGGRMVANAGFAGEAQAMAATHWTRGDELVQFTVGGTRHVVGWDAGSPEVVGSFDAGADLRLVAGRMVLRSGGAIEVYAPSTRGSAGVKVASSASNRAPVDVALAVYEDWIAGDFAGMKGLATDTVIDALRGARTRTDLFVLEGTDCVRESDTTAVCTFDSDGDRTVWRVERRGGTMQVVDLK